MQKRILAIGLVFLLLFSTVIPISIGYDVKKSDNKGQSSNLGNTLYVGSFGPDNYTRIQDAINDSVDGDTIFVYDDSSPYNESIIVDKSITVQGENRYTTIITKGGFSIIEIDHVIINGFTIEKGHLGLLIDNSSNNIIENCVFYQNYNGLILYNGAESNIIRNCIFDSNGYLGIALNGLQANNNEISYCDIFDNGYEFQPYTYHGGIIVQPTRGTKIHNCNINNNAYLGILLFFCGAQINSNNIVNNDDGLGIVINGGFPGTFCDLSKNWWGTSQGPNIFFSSYEIKIRKIEGSETLSLYGIRSLKTLVHLRPWLSIPVLDAGSQT